MLTGICAIISMTIIIISILIEMKKLKIEYRWYAIMISIYFLIIVGIIEILLSA